MNNRKQQHLTLKFSGINCGFFIAQLFFVAYFAWLLRQFGYKETFIGTMNAVGSAASILTNFAVGYITDKTSNSKAVVIVCCTTFLAATVGLFKLYMYVPYIVLYEFLGLSAFRSVQGIFEAWILKLNGQSHAGIDYGKARAVGSITYACFSLAVGAVIGKLGIMTCLYMVITAWIIIVGTSLMIPNPQSEETEQEKVTIKDGLKELLSNPAYLILLFVMSFAMVTNGSTTLYLTIILEKAGATSGQIGFAFFISSFGEFWLVFFFSKLRKKISSTILFLIGLVMMSVRSLGVAYSPNVPVMIFAQALHACAYGLVLPASVEMFDAVVSVKYKSFGMQVLRISESLASVLFGTFMGYMMEHYGYRIMLTVMSPLAVVSALALFLYHMRHRNVFEKK